jgi:hypothetical protein
MLTLRILSVLGLTLMGVSAQSWMDSYALLLQKYATPSGVRYAAWHAQATDRAALALVTDAISKAPEPPSATDLLAFRVNAYNAWVLQLVLLHYPLKSVTEVAPDFGFFSEKKIIVAGQEMTLNHLEKELLLKKFTDPRLHFGLNCASKSCPPLSPLPFNGATVSTKLESLTRAFLTSNPEALQTRGSAVAISALFDWYQTDFTSAGGLRAFINRYRQPAIPLKTQLTFLPYNWNLNEYP